MGKCGEACQFGADGAGGVYTDRYTGKQMRLTYPYRFLIVFEGSEKGLVLLENLRRYVSHVGGPYDPQKLIDKVSDDFVFVGESVGRDDRAAGRTASVAVLDRRTWDVLDRLPVASSEIYDLVLAPPSLAEGVRTGFRTAPARVTEQNQYALFRDVGVLRLSRRWAAGKPLPPQACKCSIAASVPEELPADSLFELECTLTNLGSAVLASARPHPVHIGDRWYPKEDQPDGHREGYRFRLPGALSPGECVTCRFLFRTPTEEGPYELRLTLVQEDVAWFDAIDADNASTWLVRVTRLKVPPDGGEEDFAFDDPSPDGRPPQDGGE